MTRFITVALAALLFAAPAFAAGTAPAAPVTVKAPEGGMKGNVTFDHAKHAKVDCAKCHTDKANAKAVPALAGVKAKDMKNPMHALCVECHKATPPAKATCDTCHAKK